MENSLSLLKTAISDNNITDRTARVIKACKLITDVLPYADQHKAMLEPELVKYLMLSVQFNSRSIEWLVASMVDKFKYNNRFLKQLWIGFSAIAFLSEKDEPKKANTGLRRFQAEARKVMSLTKSTVSDDGVFDSQIFKNQDFCNEIKENKEMIKLSCLKHVKKFMNVYYKELKNVLTFKPDFAELLKKFMIHTSYGKVIIKTVKVLEKLRQEDPFSCDIEIEDILLSKQSCIYDEPIKQAEPEPMPVQAKPWGRANTIRLDHKPSKSVLTRMNTLADSNVMRPFFKRSNSVLMDEVEQKPKDSNEVVRENNEMKKLEEWLAANEIGQPALISNKKDLQECLNNIENFENVLAFVFDSDSQPLAHCWEENHPSLLNTSSDEERPSTVSQYSTPPKSCKSEDHKDSNFYMLRSFKVAQALSDERNYKAIFDQNKENLETYFYNIYNTLSVRRDTLCNYNHVGMLTETLLRREPELCIGFTLHYNLLYRFIQNIEVQYIQKLLLTLFKASENAQDIGVEAYAKLLRYCQSSFFFSDISQAILHGWNSFATSKFNIDYKPPGVEDLVSIALEGEQKPYIDRSNTLQSINDIKDSLLIEESSNFQVDIDNLQPIIEADIQINREELLRNQTPSAQKLKQKKYSNYPSLTDQSLSTRDSVPTEPRATENDQGILGSVGLSSGNKADAVFGTQPGKNLADLHISSRKSANSKVSVGSQRSKGVSGASSIQNSSSKRESISSIKNIAGELRSELNSQKSARVKLDIVKKLDFNSTKTSGMKTEVNTVRKGTIPEGILKKVGKYTVSSLDNIPTEDEESHKVESNATKPVKSLNYLGTFRKAGTKKRVPRPTQGTVSMDFDVEVLDKEKIAELNRLYPTPMKAKTSAEVEAGGEEYSVVKLQENETFSLALCEFLEILFRNAISRAFDVEDIEKRLESGLGTNLLNQQSIHQMKKKYERKRDIGVPNVEFSIFWQAVFSNNCALFENLLKNYLFKIKLHHIQENNSGYAAGVLVNLILEECIKGNPDFDPYVDQIRSICKKNLPMLCKTIIQSHAWIQRDGSKVYLQDFQVKNPLGAGRLQLAQTLKLFIENDYLNGYQICNRISDTCWHVLMLWFANNQTNNMYHQIFYTIIEITFLHNDESLLTDILVKLGFIANMYKVWSDIFQNNMFRKDNHIESILYHLRKLAYLVDFISQENEEFKVLKRELKRSISWEIVRNGLLPPATQSQGADSGQGTEAKNRTTFSSFNNRRRRNEQVLSESIPSMSNFGDKGQDIGSENSFELLEKMNPGLKEVEQGMC